MIGGGAAPVKCLFIAGTEREGPAEISDVEIERIHALGILRVIHKIEIDGNAQLFERRAVHVDDGLVLAVALAQQDRQGQRIAIGVLHPAVDNLPSGVFEQVQRLAEIAAVAGRAIRRGQFIARERVRGQLVGEGGQQVGHPARGRAGAHGQLGAREIGGDAWLAIAGHGVVDEFEVEGVDQRVAHPDVIKGSAARVHHEAGHAGGLLMRYLGFDHVARGDGGKIVAACPGFGVEFTYIGQLAGLERLEQHIAITIKIDADLVEIVGAAAQGQIGAPIIGIEAKCDLPSGFEIGHDIGGCTDGNVRQRGRGEIKCVPLGLFQDRAQPGDQGQFAIVGVEGEAHRTRPGGLDRFDLCPEAEIARMPDRAERFVGPDDILDRDRAAVGKTCLGTERKFDPAAIGRGLDGFGKQAVQCKGFVPVAAHE